MLLKLRDKGVIGRLWHLERLLYTDTKARSPLEVNHLHTFAPRNASRKGAHCSALSPILFNIYVDDLLNKLHGADQLHGIPSADCQDKLGGQAYADDKNGLSSSNEGLQHLTKIMQHCLAEDLLFHSAVCKCQAMCFSPRGQDTAPDPHWDSQRIRNTTSMRFLGVHLETGLSWTVQIRHTREGISCGRQPAVQVEGEQ
jgi:hypothetical protein